MRELASSICTGSPGSGSRRCSWRSSNVYGTPMPRSSNSTAGRWSRPRVDSLPQPARATTSTRRQRVRGFRRAFPDLDVTTARPRGRGRPRGRSLHGPWNPLGSLRGRAPDRPHLGSTMHGHLSGRKRSDRRRMDELGSLGPKNSSGRYSACAPRAPRWNGEEDETVPPPLLP
jgi:hypothetical protein